MKIIANDSSRIYAIQRDFNRLFRNLQIEFYLKSSKGNDPCPKNLLEDRSATLADCRTKHKNSEVIITPDLTIAQLEEHFSDVFGLGIEILKNESGIWNKPEHKDHYSLQEQNNNSTPITI